VLPAFAQNTAWQKFSAKETTWTSASPKVPMVLKSTPVATDAFNVSGAFLGGNKFELKGEAWSKGDNVRLKLQTVLNSFLFTRHDRCAVLY